MSEPKHTLSVYDFPGIYELVLPRPPGVVETEVQTIIKMLSSHGIKQGKILELACGACPHGIPLAQAGCEMVGLDLSTEMLAEAQRRAETAGVSIRTVSGNVIDFSLDERDFDAAVFMYETFPLITEESDITSHFTSVRRHLRDGGFYIFDVDFPQGGVQMESGQWGKKKIDLPRGQVEVWHESHPGNIQAETNHLSLHCRIDLDGVLYETRDDWHFKVYSPETINRLVERLEGWSSCGLHSWRDGGMCMLTDGHCFTLFRAC